MPSNPLDNSQDYDFVILAGQRSPGLATITNANSPRRWDERRGYAFSGSRPVFRGVGLAKPTLTIRLYTTQDWDDWHEWKALVQSPPLGSRARAMDITHPILEDQGIRSVVVQDVGQSRQTDNGEHSIEIKLIEYRRLEFALSAPDGSTQNITDPIERQIQQATQEFNQALAGTP